MAIITALKIGSTQYDFTLSAGTALSISSLTVAGNVNVSGGTLSIPTSTKIGSLTTSGFVKYNNGALSIDTTTYGTSNLTLGTTSTTAAKGNHTHTLSIEAASSSATVQLAMDANTLYTITAGGSSFVFNTPADTWRPLGTTSTTAAAGNHAHGNITNTGTITSTAVTSATGVLVYDSSNKIQRATAANARSIIGAGTSNLTLGTTSTTAAKGNHTHTLTIAANSGTSALDMAANTKYQITAGGSTFIFKTPASGGGGGGGYTTTVITQSNPFDPCDVTLGSNHYYALLPAGNLTINYDTTLPGPFTIELYVVTQGGAIQPTISIKRGGSAYNGYKWKGTALTKFSNDGVYIIKGCVDMCMDYLLLDYEYYAI